MYIKQGIDYVNLDTVAKTTQANGTRGSMTPAGYAAANGSLIMATSAKAEFPDLEYLTSPLVPSHAVVLAIDPTGAVTAHPVVAFRVLRSGAAEPVFAITPPEGVVLFQGIGASGLVRLDNGEIFVNLEAAKSAVLGVPEPHPADLEPEVVAKVAGGRRHAVR